MKNFLLLAAETALAVAIAAASLSVQVAGIAALIGRDAFDVGVGYVAAFLFWGIVTVFVVATKNARVDPGRAPKLSPPGLSIHFGSIGGALDVYVDTSPWLPVTGWRWLKIPLPEAISFVSGPWSVVVFYGGEWTE